MIKSKLCVPIEITLKYIPHTISITYVTKGLPGEVGVDGVAGHADNLSPDLAELLDTIAVKETGTTSCLNMILKRICLKLF